MEGRNGRVVPAVVDADHLEELMGEQPDLRLLDVRTPGEFESSHIRGSYNVPLDQLDEHRKEIRANVDVPVVLICQSGSRAGSWIRSRRTPR